MKPTIVICNKHYSSWLLFSYLLLVGKFGPGEREIPALPLLEELPPAALLLLELSLDHRLSLLREKKVQFYTRKAGKMAKKQFLRALGSAKVHIRGLTLNFRLR